MNVGRMTHRFTLQRPSGTSGDGYADVVTVWGAIAFAQAGEGLRGGVLVATGQYTIRLWFRSDVRGDWRVKDEGTGQMFQITGYGDPDGQGTELRIACTEIQ